MVEPWVHLTSSARVDFQGRLRVDHGVVAEQQRFAVCLASVFWAGWPYQDLAFEDGGGLFVQHVLVELVARAVGGRVIEDRVVVHVLLAVDQDQPVERGLCARLRRGGR